MTNIIIGTTPTIRYKFNIVDPADLSEAILTIVDHCKTERLRKTLDTATVGTDYIEWTLTQEETLNFGTSSSLTMMLNWLTNSQIRGASAQEQITVLSNHIREVMT